MAITTLAGAVSGIKNVSEIIDPSKAKEIQQIFDEIFRVNEGLRPAANETIRLKNETIRRNTEEALAKLPPEESEKVRGELIELAKPDLSAEDRAKILSDGQIAKLSAEDKETVFRRESRLLKEIDRRENQMYTAEALRRGYIAIAANAAGKTLAMIMFAIDAIKSGKQTTILTLDSDHS